MSEASPSPVAPLVIAGLMGIIGLSLIAIGALRPGFAWRTRKIQALVESIGTTGAVIFYVALGSLMLGLALWILVKGRG